jgi:two-component system, LytTR family, sensor kinase
VDKGSKSQRTRADHWGWLTGFLCGFWVLAALFQAAWYSFVGAVKGAPVPLAILGQYMLAFWGFAALLVPLVVRVARRLSFERGQRLRSFALHLTTLVGFLVVHSLAGAAWIRGLVERRAAGVFSSFVEPLRIIAEDAAGTVMIYAATIAVVYGWDYYQRYRERSIVAAALELERAQLRAALSEARLAALQAQLQPHFLFNALHTLSTLILDGQTREANEILSHLSRYLRMTLDTASSSTVPLARELQFLDAYLRIQKARFEDRLRVILEIDESARGASVPHLILQPLVENSIRHGIGSATGQGTIVVRARAANGRLILEVEDDGRGLQPAKDEGQRSGRAPDERPGARGAEASGSGIGLRNIRERLQQLYPGDSSLDLVGIPTGGARATIQIPCQVAAPESEAYAE